MKKLFLILTCFVMTFGISAKSKNRNICQKLDNFTGITETYHKQVRRFMPKETWLVMTTSNLSISKLEKNDESRKQLIATFRDSKDIKPNSIFFFTSSEDKLEFPISNIKKYEIDERPRNTKFIKNPNAKVLFYEEDYIDLPDEQLSELKTILSKSKVYFTVVNTTTGDRTDDKEITNEVKKYLIEMIEY